MSFNFFGKENKFESRNSGTNFLVANTKSKTIKQYSSGAISEHCLSLIHLNWIELAVKFRQNEVCPCPY